MHESIAMDLETIASGNDTEQLFKSIQQLKLEDIGELLFNKGFEEFPKLKSMIPEMPSEEVQKSWTGASGDRLLKQTLAFVNSAALNYENFTGETLNDKRILDYGCGWGRIIRLMYKYTSPQNIYGCDPWEKSIELCHLHSVKGNLSVCDYVPTKPVYSKDFFDLIYAFSVFTHLSEKTHYAVLKILHHSLRKKGILAITIRPIEYWDVPNQHRKPTDLVGLKDAHNQKGFAFFPHNREKIDGDVTFGDTSISLDYICNNWSDWKIVRTEQNGTGSLQKIVYLAPV